MTEAKHTPGPWVVADEHPDGVLDRSIKADGYYVATVHDTSFAGDCWDADAALIAAAPTMADYIATRAEGGDAEAARIMEVIRGNS